jgi:hypothetical protein
MLSISKPYSFFSILSYNLIVVVLLNLLFTQPLQRRGMLCLNDCFYVQCKLQETECDFHKLLSTQSYPSPDEGFGDVGMILVEIIITNTLLKKSYSKSVSALNL